MPRYRGARWTERARDAAALVVRDAGAALSGADAAGCWVSLTFGGVPVPAITPPAARGSTTRTETDCVMVSALMRISVSPGAMAFTQPVADTLATPCSRGSPGDAIRRYITTVGIERMNDDA